MVEDEVAVAIAIGAPDPRRVGVRPGGGGRALVALVDDRVAVLVALRRQHRGRRRHDHGGGAPGLVGVGGRARGHARAEVDVVAHAVAVEVAHHRGGGAAATREVGGCAAGDGGALVGGVGDPVSVLVVAAAREGREHDEGERERTEVERELHGSLLKQTLLVNGH